MACTVCVGTSGKCYTFSRLNCTNFQLGKGDSCIQGDVVAPHVDPKFRVFSVLSGAVKSADVVLTQQHITFIQAKSTDPHRALIIVDESALHEASEVLTQSSIAFKVEPHGEF
jgi:hypothetical protein